MLLRELQRRPPRPLQAPSRRLTALHGSVVNDAQAIASLIHAGTVDVKRTCNRTANNPFCQTATRYRRMMNKVAPSPKSRSPSSSFAGNDVPCKFPAVDCRELG